MLLVECIETQRDFILVKVEQEMRKFVKTSFRSLSKWVPVLQLIHGNDVLD